jgi:hypothetical protein
MYRNINERLADISNNPLKAGEQKFFIRSCSSFHGEMEAYAVYMPSGMWAIVGVHSSLEEGVRSKIAGIVADPLTPLSLSGKYNECEIVGEFQEPSEEEVNFLQKFLEDSPPDSRYLD